MYKINELMMKSNLGESIENRKVLKSILHALMKNDDASLVNQLIEVDPNKVKYLLNVLENLSTYFDYSYSSKIDLTSFLYYIINDKPLNINAIFCPGYTKTGYKNYIGNNNTTRLEILCRLDDDLKENKIDANFHINLANIFLENTDTIKNPNWKEELKEHEEKFKDVASKYFDKESITLLSETHPKEYKIGFIDDSICQGKTYENFYKNNREFYRKMGWSPEEIKKRNDKLYTIYTILSKEMKQTDNGIYIPMETMYTRSKVMSDNGVCTMYLKKK